jgi:hypothetical protein
MVRISGMAIIEARMPDGRLMELAEVSITESGLFIMISDTDGNQVFVHRYAWDGMVKEVEKLLYPKGRQEVSDE